MPPKELSLKSPTTSVGLWARCLHKDFSPARQTPTIVSHSVPPSPVLTHHFPASTPDINKDPCHFLTGVTTPHPHLGHAVVSHARLPDKHAPLSPFPRLLPYPGRRSPFLGLPSAPSLAPSSALFTHLQEIPYGNKKLLSCIS